MSSPISLLDLLVDQLNDLASAEQQLLEALPRMAEAATGENLKQAFLDHLEQTRVHAERIEKAFANLGVAAEAKVCLAMKGLVAEGAEVIEPKTSPTLRDVALIGAARRVEHYEMAAYKSARGLAGAVGEASVADLLQQTLDEEAETDKRLCTLADSGLEAAKHLIGDKPTAAVKSTPRKPGKKKSK